MDGGDFQVELNWTDKIRKKLSLTLITFLISVLEESILSVILL